MEDYQRLKQVIAEIKYREKITQKAISEALGFRNQSYLSDMANGRFPVTSDISERISELYTYISKSWLLTGEGDMLITDTTPQIVLAKTREQNLVPFFDDVDTIGGNGRVRADVDTAYGVSNAEMIDAGDWFRGATAAIRHYGDSMVEYPSGSILAVKRITDYRTIISGKSYVVETSDFRVTKQLQDINEEYLMAYSTNTETYPDGRLIHAPFKIYKDVIRHIDLVLGCVTIEQGARYNLLADTNK